MTNHRPSVSRDVLLRVSWWVALGLLLLHLVVSPALLDGPVTRFGGSDGGELGVTVSWVAVLLLVWMAVVAFVRSGTRHRTAAFSAPYPGSTH